MSNTKLEMTFDPNTIEHLGVRMYSTLPPVLAELIANSYDADAKNVTLTLEDSEPGREQIIIEDDGYGMAFDDINQKFLRIGRNRRTEEENQVTPGGRKVIGKKGLGKLSFFGISHEVEIDTRKDGKRNIFLMDWDKIKGSKEKTYSPDIVKRDEKYSGANGTKITLRRIQRKTDFNPKTIADSLSKIFIFDRDFNVVVKHNRDAPIVMNNDMKYEGLEKDFEWKIPEDLIGFTSTYAKKNEVKGKLITSKKPISPKTNMRGVALFSRKKLVNQPEYFSESISSHFFSYLTGILEVDFIDEIKDDVISTNRQSLNWGDPGMPELRKYLQDIILWLERDWRKKKGEKREKEIRQKTGVILSQWFDKLPTEVKNKVEPVINALAKQEVELDQEITNTAVKNIHELIPEYPRYHWRNLHPDVQIITKEDYVNKRYFDAAEKASRLYVQRVKDAAGIDSGNESNDVDRALNSGNGILMVTDCANATEINIQNGQHLLSRGVLAGCRNPLAHNPEYQKKLVDTGLFTEKDCLDMLSIISHLFTRLDKAKKRP